MMPSRTGLTWIDHVSSTQDVVLDHSTDLDHGAAAGTDDQRAGRGRNGRNWEAQPGQSVAVSTLLRPARRDPPLPAQRWPWITLSVAAAVVEVVRGWGVPASVKWPNDVMIYDDDGTGRKLAGILAQVTRDASGVVLGIGLNRDFSAGHRPSELAVALSDWMAPGEVPDSPSLAETLRGTVLDAVDHLARSPNPVARVRPVMHTLGQRVRAELPGGVTLVGAASGLGESGTLLIEVEQVSAPEFDNASKSSATIDESAGIRGKIVTGETYEVSAADVVHLRPQHPPVVSDRVEGAARKTNMYDQNEGHRAGE
ncbi:biotin--[acetyl-CoA-carboxylase] ligase [Citricoccus sp. NR2]|uniref:biotin--[acetyl-CoA-carboxylase] ligase n=1 Tax=Citricoccus sp. NR2 TaxID=3004095 RepID=UPI0022DDA5D3|nr:biotin--[acetyl-CoA-carboxylase] ligase [Citricoccus sp. NR2]WBL18861.1 biotin--[acetyl-CoA-carboxylase] ligase [Citricoccus sp. NR2]